MAKPVLVITGATGIQGGSVVRALEAAGLDERYHIRAITRNASSDAAQKLRVEVVEADFNNCASIEAAFKHATAAFLMTNFWEPNAESDVDYIHGKRLVDAAVSCKLNFIVWSSLPDKSKILDGRYDVPHFSQKHRVEDYIFQQNIPAAFVYAGSYITNWLKFPGFTGPIRTASGTVIYQSPLRADVGLPIIDMEADFGLFVSPIFENPNKYIGKRILAAAAYMTVEQMASAYTKVTGEAVTISRASPEDMPLPDRVKAEIMRSVNSHNAIGFFNGEPLQPSHQLYDPPLKLTTFEQWLQRSHYRVPTS